MSVLDAKSVTIETLADLVERLGGIPLERIRLHPAPSTATEQDVVATEQKENRLCELVDGVLVEKAMGYRESFLAVVIASLLRSHVDVRNLGLVTGTDGMMRLFPGLVRIPDVAFASWDRIPGRKVPDEPLPDLVPDLVVEVLSKSNTPGEMQRKRNEYFAAGVRIVWLVDPDARTVCVYDRAHHHTKLDATEILDGGAVLPEFRLPLAQLFAELDRKG